MSKEEFYKRTYFLGVDFTIEDWENIISYLPEQYANDFRCQLREVKNHNFYLDESEGD